MRLSRESRYAVSALVRMAGYPAGTVLNSRVVAAEADLPPSYLAKILRQLAVGGVLRSQRGRGFTLAEAPDHLTLGRILAAIEGPGLFDERCIFWRETCSNDEPCPLHFRWREMKVDIEGKLSALTLAEIVEHGGVADGAWIGLPARAGAKVPSRPNDPHVS